MSCKIVSGVSCYSEVNTREDGKVDASQSECATQNAKSNALLLNVNSNRDEDADGGALDTSDMNVSINSASASEITSNQNVLGKKRSASEEPKEERRRKRTRRAKKKKPAWKRKKSRLEGEDDKHGKPLAPDNTTQFIMNDHCEREVNIEEIQRRCERLPTRNHHGDDHDIRPEGQDNEEEFYSSPEDESDYLQQQFYEAYNNMHNERLNSMSKEELVKEYVQLEVRVEDLEDRIKQNQGHNSFVDSMVQTDIDTTCDPSNDTSLKEKMERLIKENERLIVENRRLRCAVNHSEGQGLDISSHGLIDDESSHKQDHHESLQQSS